MELASKSPLRSGLSSRGGILALAAVAAIAAAVLVATALHQARKTSDGGAPVSVLVADRLIAKGTPGDAVGADQSFRVARVREAALVAGGVTDLSQIRGKVATRDIDPGEQLSTARFTSSGGALTDRLTGNQRAVSVPVDSAHGMIGDIKSGDHVDVLAGFNQQSSTGRTSPVVRKLARDVVVLKAAKGSGSGNSANSIVTLRVTDRVAAKLAYTADNGKVWVMLRPPAGAVDSAHGVTTLETLLTGASAVSTDGATP